MIVKEVDLTGQTLSNYKVVEQLGRGGMATVYKAHELSLNRIVALKVLASRLSEDQDYIKRFQREAQAAAQLNHPNIVQIYSIGEEKGLHYFAMEYIKGESLADVKKRIGVFPPAQAVTIIKQVADALADAHKAGLVHRDIKPSNIMMDPDGRAKVTDFGIAYVSTAKTKLTQDGSIIGTPEYLSPEQCEGKTVDQRSDVYSLGVTLYELLTGKTPYEADTPVSMLMKIVKGNFPPICEVNPNVPQPLCLIVDKMMETDVNQRYASMKDVTGDLSALPLEDSAPGAAPKQVMATVMVDTGEEQPVQAASGKSNKMAALIMAAVIVLLLGGAFAAKMLFLDKEKNNDNTTPPAISETQTPTPDSPAGPAEDQPTGEEQPTGETADPEAEDSSPPADQPADTVTHQTVEAASIAPDSTSPQQHTTGAQKANANVNVSTASTSQPSSSTMVTPQPRPQPQPKPAPTKPLPPANSCLVTTQGDSDKADVIGAYVQEMLGRGNFAVVDGPSAAGRDIADVARNHLVVTANQLGSTMLEYYGQSTEQYTVSITIKLVNPKTAMVIKGPKTRTVKYTAINAEENIREAVDTLISLLRL
jgi:serine/threonine-protein kinase